MEITIADGKHSYDFEYTLAEVPANQGFTLDSPGFSGTWRGGARNTGSSGAGPRPVTFFDEASPVDFLVGRKSANFLGTGAPGAGFEPATPGLEDRDPRIPRVPRLRSERIAILG
jgi:hypothetical protein